MNLFSRIYFFALGVFSYCFVFDSLNWSRFIFSICVGGSGIILEHLLTKTLEAYLADKENRSHPQF